MSITKTATKEEVAKHLKVSRRTVERMIATGILPTLNIPGRNVRLDLHAVDAALRGDRIPQPDKASDPTRQEDAHEYDPLVSAVADRVKARRKEMWRSQQSVADAMRDLGHDQYHQTTIARIEAGTREVRVSEVGDLAKVLKAPLGWLLLCDGSPDGSGSEDWALGYAAGRITAIREIKTFIATKEEA